jgi:hypothetical protein
MTRTYCFAAGRGELDFVAEDVYLMLRWERQSCLRQRAVAQLAQKRLFLRHSRESGNPVRQHLLPGSRFRGSDEKVLLYSCLLDVRRLYTDKAILRRLTTSISGASTLSPRSSQQVYQCLSAYFSALDDSHS